MVIGCREDSMRFQDQRCLVHCFALRVPTQALYRWRQRSIVFESAVEFDLPQPESITNSETYIRGGGDLTSIRSIKAGCTDSPRQGSRAIDAPSVFEYMHAALTLETKRRG